MRRLKRARLITWSPLIARMPDPEGQADCLSGCEIACQRISSPSRGSIGQRDDPTMKGQVSGKVSVSHTLPSSAPPVLLKTRYRSPGHGRCVVAGMAIWSGAAALVHTPPMSHAPRG